MVALVTLAGPLVVVFAPSLSVLSSSAAFKARSRACKAASEASAVAGGSNVTSAALFEVTSSFPPTSKEIVGFELCIESLSNVNVAVDVGAGGAIVCMVDALTRKCAACSNSRGGR